jgi:hypothetical protein
MKSQRAKERLYKQMQKLLGEQGFDSGFAAEKKNNAEGCLSGSENPSCSAHRI